MGCAQSGAPAPVQSCAWPERLDLVEGHRSAVAIRPPRLVLDGDIALYSNVKLVLNPAVAPGLSEMYAKVISDRTDGRDASPTHICLELTSLPEDVRAFLADQRALAFRSAS